VAYSKCYLDNFLGTEEIWRNPRLGHPVTRPRFQPTTSRIQLHSVNTMQLCSYSRTFQHFIEPEGSSPCSQDPSTGPYPEPVPSSTYIPSYLTYILILSTHLRLGLPSGLFPSGLPINILYAFLFSPIHKHSSIFHSHLDYINLY
jgi:hypothetical protein